MIPTMMKADHVGFVVPDLRQAVDFFVDVLGAKIVFMLGPFDDEDAAPPGQALPAGQSWMYEQMRIAPGSRLNAALLRLTPELGLEFYEIDSPQQRTEHVRAFDVGAPHLSFRVRDLDAAVAYLRTVPGVVLHGEPQAPDEGDLAGMRWIHFETPWGLVLEVDEWPVSPYGDEPATT
jgi:catechol 2,3-dioxygenase-like lactoylglutathione lyase family enzyme